MHSWVGCGFAGAQYEGSSFRLAWVGGSMQMHSAVCWAWLMVQRGCIHVSGASVFLHVAFLIPCGVSSFSSLVHVSLQQATGFTGEKVEAARGPEMAYFCILLLRERNSANKRGHGLGG